jgi:uncharacterized protein (TIGR02611 family)
MCSEMMAVEMRAVGRFLLRGTRRAVITVVGFTIVCLGVAGLVLPVLPGWVLIIAGLAVLSREYSWAQSALAFARRKAVQSGAGLRSLATRRRRRTEVINLSAEDLVDLTEAIDLSEVEVFDQA